MEISKGCTSCESFSFAYNPSESYFAFVTDGKTFNGVSLTYQVGFVTTVGKAVVDENTDALDITVGTPSFRRA